MSAVENQSQKIRQHLLTKGTITSMEAFQLYGCTRLSARIFNLRKKGWDIQTINCDGVTRYGDPCNYAKYRFISKPEGK